MVKRYYGGIMSANLISTSSVSASGFFGTHSQMQAKFSGTWPVVPTVSDVVSGALWIWGQNNYGQLGDNTIVHRSSAVQTVAGGSVWASATDTIRYATSVIKTDGTLWMWGQNSSGQLGDGTIIHRSSPVQTIAGGSNWIKVSSNRDWTAAIKSDGTLWTWGYGGYGSLGDNTIIHRSSPVQTIAGGSTWSKVATSRTSTYGIKTDGTLWAWGKNNSAGLADTTSVSKSSPIQTIAGGNNWSSISANGFNAAAIKTDGTLWIWGSATYGGMGAGAVTSADSPIQTISGGTNWRQVSLGEYHVMGLKTDGTLWTWGYNQQGSLGINTVINTSSPAQTMASGSNWAQISAGGYHSTAIKTDGTLWTWGNNGNGGLGTNDTTHRSSPVQTVVGGSNWKYVVGGMVHTMAIK